jgi:NDP-sugar pyrophosphorylase family protein
MKKNEVSKNKNVSKNSVALPVDVILMAGGKGERLKSLTEKTPKPLLKIGEKPVIDYNLDRLKYYGIENIWISVGYLAEQIMDYLGDGSQKNLTIQYIKEKKPLGTAGAIAFVKNFENDAILIMNSDLLTNINFEDFYKNFIKSGASMCIATTKHKVEIPYTVLETSEEEFMEILEIKTHPSYVYQVNAGIYFIQRKYLNLIPKDTFFDATDLIQKLLDKKEKVSYYSILGYWLDIGKPEDFAKAQEDIKYIKF